MSLNNKKRGFIFIVFGCMLILSALSMYLFNAEEDKLAGESSRALYESFAQEVKYIYPHEIEEEEKMELGGYPMFGSIKIESLGITLPVLDNWNYDMLKVSPCRYTGSLDGKDLIIMGHNYKSHFKPLEEISEGADVIFTDIGGNEYTFTVAALEMLDKTDVDKLDTKQYPLTLFTCNYSGQGRIVVRCVLK